MNGPESGCSRPDAASRLWWPCVGSLLLGLVFALVPRAAVSKTWLLASPSGHTAVSLTSSPADGIKWSVAYMGAPVLDPAPIGLDFADEAAPRLDLLGTSRAHHDERVTGLIGKSSTARDHYHEVTIRLADAAHGRTLELTARAYDDGAAYRWRVIGDRTFRLAREVAGFGVPAAAKVWAMPVKDFQSSYEEYYRNGQRDGAVAANGLVALPLLFHAPSGAWGAVTEAALVDWAGLYLTRDPAAPGLSGRLSPRLDEPAVAVVGHAGTHVSPWRVVLLGGTSGALIQSNLVEVLNPAPDRRDWSWVHPGKTSFPWWNDYSWPGAPFIPGLNTATMKAYIDFDAANGIAYHTLDGYKGQAWYGGPIGPDGTPQDLTHARAEIDMPEVLRYARARGVRIRLWTHWKPFGEQMDRALDAWASWGVEGFMVDFMNRDDQQMVDFYTEVARKAADRHMTVNFHGAFKPTGEIRTWPNMISREAVRGIEYNKFEGNPGSTPEHEAVLPFTRMLAGPFDVHEGGFDAVLPDEFKIRNTAPQVMGTRARAMALYVVDENPLAMVADSPVRYRGAVGWPFVTAVPTAWDETRVLAAEPGHFIAIARRKGGEWWLGAITDRAARAIPVSLGMLGQGGYTADIFTDDAAEPQGVATKHSRVDRRSTIMLRLAPSGGFAARITPR